MDEAIRRVRAALGRDDDANEDEYLEYKKLLEADPRWREADRLWQTVRRIGVKSRLRREGDRYLRIDTEYWHATTLGKGRGARLQFHAPDLPVQVWAVTIDRSGVHWFDAEVTKVTERNVMVHYAGERPRLDRWKLWRHWAWWRGVMFVSSRTGYVAGKLDEIWQERYGYAAGGRRT